MQSRKAEFKLYPTKVELPLMEEVLALQCRVDNTFKEEHKRRYVAGEATYNFVAMCQDLTRWRANCPALANMNAQSLQVNAKRVSLAFTAFFRRLAAGETPGYPRFKSLKRYKGWGYKAHGDGWKLFGSKSLLTQNGKFNGNTYSSVRLSGIGTISLRGRTRFFGTPKTAEVIRKNGTWYLSVTFAVEDEAIARTSGTTSMAFDWGIKTLLTQVVGDVFTGAVETIDNPKWLKQKLGLLKDLQKTISKLEDKAIAQSGKSTNYPVSVALQKCYDRLRRIHQLIARQRHDFYHKLSAKLVEQHGLIATEKLAIAKMVEKPAAPPAAVPTASVKPASKMLKKAAIVVGAANVSGSKKKINSKSLRQGTYDAAGATLLQYVRYKAEEAGTEFYEHPTKMLKPSQRCYCCGNTKDMPLGVRVYDCVCGNKMDRDENAARTVMRYTYDGKWWVKGKQDGNRPGGGLAVLA